MTPALRSAAALYADARLHEEIADQWDGTGDPYFDKLAQGHRESARLAFAQADAMVRNTLKVLTDDYHNL